MTTITTTATSTHSVSPSLSPSTSAHHQSPRADISSMADNNSNTDNFPIGLRVLIVDDDPICLLILDRMLRRCQYQVTAYGKATEALAMLRENRDSFDVIISDVCMPDMDGFKLLELVGLEMDLPVIMMSANGETSAVMKGIKHGACDYLLKPVRMEELRNIWQHVVRKKWRNTGPSCMNEDDRVKQVSDDGDYTSSANEGPDVSWKQSKKRKDVKEEDEDLDIDNDDPSTTKKPRVVWSVDLHQQFVGAVNQLGIDKAVPKRILELMNVQGLTRENVASHLQKYRLYLKRISGGAGHPSGGLNSPFPTGTTDTNFASVSAANLASLNELRAITGSGPLSPQGLVSTLQAGILGRLGSPNNIKVDPSILLQLTALQNANNGGLMSRSPVLPTYNSQPLITSQGAFQPGISNVIQVQPTNLGTYDKGTQQVVANQQHQVVANQQVRTNQQALANQQQQVLTNQHQQVLANQQQQQVLANQHQQVLANQQQQQALANQTSFGAIGQLSGANNNNTSSNNALLIQAIQHQQGIKNGLPTIPTADIIAQSGLISTAETGSWVGGVLNETTARIPLAVSPPLASGLDGSLSNEVIMHKFGSKFSGMKQDQDPNWQVFQDYGEVPSNGPIRNINHNQTLSLGGVGQGQLCSTGFGVDNDNGRFKASRHDHFQGENSLKVKEEGHDWLPEQVSDELLSMVFKQVRS